MSHKTHLTYLLISIVITVFLVAGTNVFTYYKLTRAVNQELSTFQGEMSDALRTTQDSLLDAIEQEHVSSATQRSALENKTIENFKKLQDVINRQSAQIKLDLESQVSTVASRVERVQQQSAKELEGLRRQSAELESKISEINVESSDFSAIVQDVVKAVVSVRTPSQQGSGVFFDERGYVMTNKHVIQGASGTPAVQVIDYAGRIYIATLIGTATNADLAVLKISGPESFPYLEFASGDSIRVGQRVIAVGNPLGLSFSVTEGIISGVNRKIDASGIGYLQTDVPINPGNSGGPLIDAGKHLVGITTLKFEQGEGLGFALPAPLAQQVAEQATSS